MRAERGIPEDQRQSAPSAYAIPPQRTDDTPTGSEDREVQAEHPIVADDRNGLPGESPQVRTLIPAERKRQTAQKIVLAIRTTRQWLIA